MKYIKFALIIIFILGGLGFYIWNNKTVSTINIDINPSIELKLDRKNIIKEAVALNDDASEIVKNMKDKTVDEFIETLYRAMLEEDYLAKYDGEITILLYTSGNIDSDEVKKTLDNKAMEKNLPTEVLIIETITKEDEDLALKLNISPSKAAYINSVVNEYENVDIDNIKDRSISEIKNVSERGYYCDEGYTLDFEHCKKEVDRIPALKGNVCPDWYYEYKGKCYKEVGGSEGTNLVCRSEFTLNGNDCVNTTTYDAMEKCEEGQELRNGYCITKKYIADAYEFCRDPGRTLYQHKCLATKPTINGGCLKGDMLYKGKCVNTKNDYYAAEWKCPNGQVKSNADGSLLDNDTKCYEEVKTKVSMYECSEGDTLVGKKCQRTFIEPAFKERLCPSGYTKLEGNRCIDYNNVADKISGYYCKDKENRLDGDTCVVYEIIEAHH